MSRSKQILLYVLIAIVVMVALVVVWYYFSRQIIFGLGWVALFVLVFGAGFIVGRMSARKSKSGNFEIESRGDE